MIPKGYKTVLFNAVMTLGMLITVWSGYDTKDEIETIKTNFDLLDTSLAIIWGIGNVWLRAITDSPIFKKR